MLTTILYLLIRSSGCYDQIEDGQSQEEFTDKEEIGTGSDKTTWKDLKTKILPENYQSYKETEFYSNLSQEHKELITNLRKA